MDMMRINELLIDEILRDRRQLLVVVRREQLALHQFRVGPAMEEHLRKFLFDTLEYSN